MVFGLWSFIIIESGWLRAINWTLFRSGPWTLDWDLDSGLSIWLNVQMYTESGQFGHLLQKQKMILINNQYCNVNTVFTVQTIRSLINSLKAIECFQISLNLKQTFRELSLLLRALHSLLSVSLHCTDVVKTNDCRIIFFLRRCDFSIETDHAFKVYFG